MSIGTASPAAELQSAGLDQRAVAEWIAAQPTRTGDFSADRPRYRGYWQLGGLIAGCLPKPARSAGEARRGAVDPRRRARAARALPRRPCRDALRRADAPTRALRPRRGPGLRRGRGRPRPGADRGAGRGRGRARRATRTASRSTRASSSPRFSADPSCGLHLCHAMLLPRAEIGRALAEVRRATARSISARRDVERHGKAAIVTADATRASSMPRTTTTLDAMEIAVDVASSIPTAEVAVLRGDRSSTRNIAGRRVFSAGINLTHLYYGKIPFLWFLIRDLGFVNKMFRGAGAARRAARRGARATRSRSSGSRRSRPSPSAATARSCWRSTTTSPRATPT